MKCLRTICCLLPLSLPLMLLAGCQSSEDVTTYQVDRPQMDRLLGAIFLQKEGPNWFFKFVAPAAAVKDHEEEVAQLINSVRLEDKKGAVPAWELPKGWEEKAGGGEFRYKTLRFGADKDLELTVSRAGGNLLDNVNRWLGEEGLGLARAEQELRDRRIIKDEKVKGRSVVLVDIMGTKTRRAPMGMGQGRRSEAIAEPKFDTPADWERFEPVKPPTRIGFRLPGASKEEPQVTISAIPGQWGGLLPNYQRWQKQVGLPPSDKLPDNLKTIEVAGQQAHYIDLQGPAGKDQKRLLVVVVTHDQLTWFFKLLASPELVGKQEDAFKAFVKSARF